MGTVDTFLEYSDTQSGLDGFQEDFLNVWEFPSGRRLTRQGVDESLLIYQFEMNLIYTRVRFIYSSISYRAISLIFELKLG